MLDSQLTCAEAPSREDRVPDPEEDPILAAFYSIQGQHGEDEHTTKSGIIAVQAFGVHHIPMLEHQREIVADELDLLNFLVDVILDVDPDIVTGWQIQSASWGFVNMRANHYGLYFMLCAVASFSLIGLRTGIC